MKKSAGILLYRFKSGELQIFLIYPGGPFWSKKGDGSWSIPKGEYADEAPIDAAKREFKEETGFDPPAGEYMELTPFRQKSGKLVSAWAVEGDVDASKLVSNTFTAFGKEYPEAEKGEWFAYEEALNRIRPCHTGMLQEFRAKISDVPRG